MASKKKTGAREKVSLFSTGTDENGNPTKWAYYTFRNKRNAEAKGKGKLELMKFDPRAWNPETQKYGMHVLHKEKKIAK